MRNPVVDFLKALASQAIVLHHLSLYTPMADVLEQRYSLVMAWLQEDARYAVQVFLVIGGFLAAQSFQRLLRDNPQSASTPQFFLQSIWRRYLRLSKPFIVAMVCAVVFAALAALLEGSHIAWPSLYQLFAHVLLIHDILGVPALSAGVWYVAIDLQLYVLFALLMWLGCVMARHCVLSPMRLAGGFVVVLTVLSLLWLNRQPQWDEFGFYFFGSYGLGVLCGWAVSRPNWGLWVMAVVALVGLALFIQWRDRIALAGLVAVLLVLSQRCYVNSVRLGSGHFARLGDMSYSLFLIHYPVLVLCGAVAARWTNASVSMQLLAFVAAWALSLAAADLLFRWVEQSAIPNKNR